MMHVLVLVQRCSVAVKDIVVLRPASRFSLGLDQALRLPLLLESLEQDSQSS